MHRLRQTCAAMILTHRDTGYRGLGDRLGCSHRCRARRHVSAARGLYGRGAAETRGPHRSLGAHGQSGPVWFRTRRPRSERLPLDHEVYRGDSGSSRAQGREQGLQKVHRPHQGSGEIRALHGDRRVPARGGDQQDAARAERLQRPPLLQLTNYPSATGASPRSKSTPPPERSTIPSRNANSARLAQVSTPGRFGYVHELVHPLQDRL